MNALFLMLHLALSPVALAGGGGPPSSPSAMGDQADDDMEFMNNFSQIATEIGLSTDQQAKIKELFYNSQKDAIDLQAQAQRAQLDLRHAMDADTPDEKVVMKALDAHIAADGALQRNRVKLLLEVRKVVTTEQWDKLKELRSRRGPGGGHMGGMGPGGMSGMGPGSMGGGMGQSQSQGQGQSQQ